MPAAMIRDVLCIALRPASCGAFFVRPIFYIPDDIELVDLKLARNLAIRVIKFNRTPIEQICAASAIDVSVFRDQRNGDG